jgi:hypothetical protein
MQDRVSMRACDRIAQIEQQGHARAQVEIVASAMRGQVAAFDQFHRIPKLTCGTFAAVDQLRNVRMAQACHHIALEQESGTARCVDLQGQA